MERPKPLDIELGRQKETDAVYAVNKAGDFSKTSVREPWWPQDAAGKVPMDKAEQDLNTSEALGKVKVDGTIARMIKLGDLPRGIRDLISINDYKDGAAGVVTLYPESMEERVHAKLDQIDKISGFASNHPSPMPWGKEVPTFTDKARDKFTKKEQGGVPMPLPVADRSANMVLQDSAPAIHKQLNIRVPKNQNLYVLD